VKFQKLLAKLGGKPEYKRKIIRDKTMNDQKLEPQTRSLSTTDARRELGALKVGGRIWFAEEKLGYTVQARSRRFLVCNKPFNLRRTVLYCIVDLKEWVRGPENLIFGMGAETRQDCEEMLERLERVTDCGFQTEVSHRHRIPVEVRKVA
jgi:hypothetical protein